jgi:curved DNA-binding protein CbpA
MDRGDNPYEILGVEEDSSDSDIKKAYRKLALKHHPDKQSTEEDKAAANNIFAKLSHAYETLSDPVKKYDYRLAHGKKEKKATKVSKTETGTSTSTTNTSSASGRGPNVKTTTETSYEPPKPKPQPQTNSNYNYSSPSPTTTKPEKQKVPFQKRSNSWTKVRPNPAFGSPKHKQQSSTSSTDTAETKDSTSSSSTEPDTSYSYTAPPKKKTSIPAPKKASTTTDTGYSYIPSSGKAENVNPNGNPSTNVNTNVNTTLPKKKVPVKKVPNSNPNTSYSYVAPNTNTNTNTTTLPKKKVPVKQTQTNTSYSYVPPPGKSTEHVAPPPKKVDTSYNYVPPPNKVKKTFPKQKVHKQVPTKTKTKPLNGAPTATGWSRTAPTKKTTPSPSPSPTARGETIPTTPKATFQKVIPNNSVKKVAPLKTTTPAVPKKPIISKGETEYVWTRDSPNTMATITAVNHKKNKQANTNTNNPQFHDPFQVFDNVMKDEYGDGYKKSSSPSGWSDPSTFSKANSKMETKKKKKGGVLGFFGGTNKSKPNDNDVVSMTMSTKTLQHDDGRIEVKTITKIVRQDGSVERVVQSSLVEDTASTRADLPHSTTAEHHKQVPPLKQ